jgi:hypothetical protein
VTDIGEDAVRLRAILSTVGELRLAVTGGSMRPVLLPGDFLVVHPLEGAARIGDVLVYWRGGHMWAHRLVARSPAGGALITKGDARGRPDAPVAPGELVGRAVAVERAGRRLDLAGLLPRLTGLALNFSASAVRLGLRLAGRGGRADGGRTRRIGAAGFVLALTAPRAVLALLPPSARGLRSGTPDLVLELELRAGPTTGGRWGLSGRPPRFTFSSPAVVARADLAAGTCRGELVPGQEAAGLAALLRILVILLTVERGGGLALHSSAVLWNGRAYLFTGPGGAGKSTAMSRSVEAGAVPLADDLVLLRPQGDKWLAWGPPLEPAFESSPVVAPAGGAPLAGLLLPARGGPRLRLEPVSPAAWAAAAAVFPPGSPLYSKLLDRLGAVAESVPAWRLAYLDRTDALAGLFTMLEKRR